MKKTIYIAPMTIVISVVIDHIMVASADQNGLGTDMTKEEYDPNSGVAPSRGLYWDE